jgi:hypothetical protein
MANHVELYFGLSVQADGTSTTIATNTNSTPFTWPNPPAAGQVNIAGFIEF